MEFETLRCEADPPVATVTLNRPERLNTIVPPMPDEFEAAITAATRDDSVKVIVVRGAGRAFSAGYDFGGGFNLWNEHITTGGVWDPGKDFARATDRLVAPTQKFMSMWRSHKPVIVQVHGWCVGGASDTALCGDLVIASEDARIGTPYSRMWGAYLSGMWIYRLGLTRAKEYALTGKPLSGREAADAGLINEAVPFEDLEETVRERAAQLASIPSSQLAAMKLVVNHAFEGMGVASTQTLGPILDGLMRNTPRRWRSSTGPKRKGSGPWSRTAIVSSPTTPRPRTTSSPIHRTRSNRRQPAKAPASASEGGSPRGRVPVTPRPEIQDLTAGTASR